MTDITEASLGRVWQHAESPDTDFAVLTAFRGEYTREENLQRNRSLAADLRAAGFGFFFLDGHWIENPGTENERRVREDSVFVISRKNPNFANIIHRLGNDYGQEAVLVRDQQGTRLIFNDGSQQQLGKLRPGALGNIYSQLRRKKSATFVFETERDDPGWISRLAGIAPI